MADEKDEHIRKLEETIRKFLEPIRGVPFPIVIKALTGYRVLKFESVKDKDILELLINASKLAGQEAAKKGIIADRPNEAGNYIEPFVINALTKVGFQAHTPTTSSGTQRSVGYPDIELRHSKGWVGYIDCKTFASKSLGTTLRAFYLSPSRQPKITKNAVHLVLSFELENNGKVFTPKSWHLYDIYGLAVQVKYEFNANNKELYSKGLLLAEGPIK